MYLVTCTPYGVNSHRLLVRGHRVANQEEAKSVRVTAGSDSDRAADRRANCGHPLLLLFADLAVYQHQKEKTPEVRK